MNILITGGAGFIGSHVADACVTAGHRVIIIDDLSMGKIENINPGAIFHKTDIRNKDLEKVFLNERPEVVIHHAAQMDVRKSVESPLLDASVNILGSVNLLELSRKAGVQKFIFASTGGAIYGDQDYFPADEAHPLRPVSPYGISKLAVEKYLHFYRRVYGLSYVVLRYANVYGPRQNPHGEAGVIAIFTSKLLAGKQPVINGDGCQTRDYIFVDDVVKANMLAIHHPETDIFNVGTGSETSVNEIFSSLRLYTASSLEAKHGPAKQGEQLRSVLSYDHIHTAYDWKPTVTLREGLQRTVEYIRRGDG
jgi:UDP-glucose 4-epimerase